MNYNETEQKRILREIENEILALVAINIDTEKYEVIYSDSSYREYHNRFRGEKFFEKWAEFGIPQIYPPDREKMLKEISRENLLKRLKEHDSYVTVARFINYNVPVYCRVKAAVNTFEPDVLILSIRNIDIEMRHEIKRISEMEELLRREKIYQKAILANSAGFMEVNLSENIITTKIYDKRDEWVPRELELPELGDPVPYDSFVNWWADNMLLSDKTDFLEFSRCSNLISSFLRGERVLSTEFRARTASGNVSICRETYYISMDDINGDVLAVCVLYDLTAQHKRERDMQELKETLRQMRMKNFISQMHPHFLYNALSSIREIVLTDPEYGANLLYDFTTHLRASINAMSNDNKIWFSQELENIKAYVNIEKMRFGGKLNVEYDIDTEDFRIIPLSIQPIVENAVKHGIYENGDKSCIQGCS